jgi:hypothetical protein
VRFTQIINGLYSIQCDDPEAVTGIPELLYLSASPKYRLLNRWSVGFTQSNASPVGKGEYGVETLRGLTANGLTGNGTILTIQDGGFDFTTPFLGDPLVPVVQGVLSEEHRKVGLFTEWSTGGNAEHGTAAAGAAVGNAVCENELNLYDGMAPEARLHAISIGSESGEIWPMPATRLGSEMDRTGASVCINAWGSTDKVAVESWIWDLMAESNPNKLFVFAAGNDGVVTDQGGAKNVLTVGALDILGPQRLETQRGYAVVSDGDRYEASLWEGGMDLFRSSIVIENEVIAPGRILFAREATDICNAQVLAAIVTFRPTPCLERVPFPVLVVPSDTFLEAGSYVTVEFTREGNDGLNVTEWSGVGPGRAGILKPDVVAPGTAVVSAAVGAGDPDRGCDNVTSALHEVSGTSMAAASVGGAAVLVQQFFADGFYPSGHPDPIGGFDASANLVRAMIVASADPVNRSGVRTPSMASGHGAVNLANVLRFDGGLKVVHDFTIASREHFAWSVYVTEATEPLRIALAYLDATVEAERPGVINDLDLFVELRNGSIVYGNMRSRAREERFSTMERVIIWPGELQVGRYVLHVVAHRLTASVKLALLAAGPIDPREPFQASRASLATCRKGVVGLHCQINVIVLEETEQQVDLPPASVEYFRLDVLPNDIRDVYVTFTHDIPGQFAVLAEIDGQPTALREYGQYWEYTDLKWSLVVPASVASRISYVGLALVNLGGSMCPVTAVMSFVPSGGATATGQPSVPEDYYLAMVVGYVLVGMLVPVIAVLAVCLFISRRRGPRLPAMIA